MSTQTKIDESLVKYLQNIGYRKDKIIDDLADETSKLGSVSQMQIAKEQGQFLEIITKLSKAISCLEVGRFTGMSTLFIARGLSAEGKITTIDNSDEFLSLAKKYWDLDNMSSKIESIIGDGVEIMQSMIDRQHSYDFIFIDHWKDLYLKDLKTLEENDLIKSNAWIFADNVILFNLEDYLDYVRSSPNYKSKFIPAKREYSKSHPDGVEISIFKNEV